MKKLALIIVLLASMVTNAQNSGLGFNYQAVVRNANGMLLTNSNVNLRVSLYPGQNANAATWVETHNVLTDYSGCFGITVGKGDRDETSVVANYSDINFAGVYYWMKIEVLEGATYREISYAQLPSSPYSEVAYNAAIFPPGIIVPFAGEVDKIPAGWLLCDGSEVSRTEYSALYDVIGICWGMGNAMTTFNLPDLRGMFLRGVSGDSGNDPDANSRLVLNDHGGNTGNNVGSYQSDAIRNITGEYATGSVTPSSTGQGFVHVEETGCGGGQDGDCWDSRAASFTFDASRIVPVGGDNRPKNVYVNYIIKY